jgi:hypothetical protein
MGFGTPPVALEGDYSDWEKIWEWDIPDGLLDIDRFAITFDQDRLYISYLDATPRTRLAILNVKNASQIFLSPSGVNYLYTSSYVGYMLSFMFNIAGAYSVSVRGRYVVLGVPFNGERIEVWKNGVKQWESPRASEAVPGATYYYAVAIRHDGKYVAAVTDNYKLVCFEGS